MPEPSLEARLAEATAHLPPDEARAVRRDFDAVEQAGITSIEQLVEAVDDTAREFSIREIACSLVATLKERSAAPALARTLEEGHDGLEWVAAKSLIWLRADETAPTLIRVLEHGSPSTQSAAAYVLRWLDAPNTIPPLRAVASDRHRDPEVRGHAIEALGALQAREALHDLIAFVSDPSPEVRYWAAYALGEIGDPASIPALEQMAATEIAILRHGSLKQEALDALASIRARGDDSGHE